MAVTRGLRREKGRRGRGYRSSVRWQEEYIQVTVAKDNTFF